MRVEITHCAEKSRNNAYFSVAGQDVAYDAYLLGFQKNAVVSFTYFQDSPKANNLIKLPGVCKSRWNGAIRVFPTDNSISVFWFPFRAGHFFLQPFIDLSQRLVP